MTFRRCRPVSAITLGKRVLKIETLVLFSKILRLCPTRWQCCKLSELTIFWWNALENILSYFRLAFVNFVQA